MKSIAAITLGGAAGYAWYRLVGCSGGGCPIWSNPYLSALSGSFLGWAWGGGAGPRA